MGKHFSCLYLPEEVAAGKPDAELKLAASAGHFKGQGWRVRKDGSRFWAIVAISTIRDHTGALRGYGMLIMESEAHEKAQRESTRSVPAVAVVGEDGRIVLVNSELEMLLGYPRAELLGPAGS